MSMNLQLDGDVCGTSAADESDRDHEAEAAANGASPRVKRARYSGAPIDDTSFDPNLWSPEHRLKMLQRLPVDDPELYATPEHVHSIHHVMLVF